MGKGEGVYGGIFNAAWHENCTGIAQPTEYNSWKTGTYISSSFFMTTIHRHDFHRTTIYTVFSEQITFYIIISVPQFEKVTT
jgi:hypothetical protein